MWRFVITSNWQLTLFILLASLACCSSSTSTQVPLIDSSTSQATLSNIWIIFGLKLPDRIVFFVLGPPLLIIQILIIAMFLKYNSLFAKPGNVFFALVVIETVLNVHFIFTAIYHSVYSSPQIPKDYMNICSGLGYVQALFETNHLSYLYIFLFYVVFIIRYTLKKKANTFWIAIHIVVFLVCLGVTSYMYFENFIGLNFTGICGITSLFKLTYSVDWNILAPILGIIFTFFFFGFGIFTYQYYKKHMPGGQLKNRKCQFSKIILMFVIGFFICQLYPNICCIALAIQFNQGKPIEVFHPMITFANFLRMAQCYFTIFLIVWNNQFRQKLKFTLKKFIMSCCKKKPPQSQDEDILKAKLQLSQIFVNEKLLRIKDNANQIDLLFVSQIYTIISGLYAILFQYFKFSPEGVSGREFDEQRPINFKESITFQIDKQTMKNYELQTRMMFKLQILRCRLIFYFPKVFLNFLMADGLHNIFESFTLLENAQKILSTAADGQGGKSGQFFFFTADRKYVLKTITQEEFNFLKSHMINFYEHYRQNPESLLAKIYGLMTFKGDQIQRTYRLILMKNIMGCRKEQIERVYDLKGSTYDREVTSKKILSHTLQYVTLKDIDFIKYQGRLHIDDRDSHILRMIIKKDAQFLKGMNLIDYSFLVVRVKWKQTPENPQFWNEFQRIQHSERSNEYYHLGIIDYLQLWDLQKKSQSLWKKLTGKKDISAINPVGYCSRFLNFIDQISINFESSARAQGARSNMIQIMEKVRQKVLKQQQQEEQSEKNEIQQEK